MADDLPARLRAALAVALAARDLTSVAALRTALTAIANAEAVPAGPSAARSPAERPPANHGQHFAGSAAGLAGAEANRRQLTAAQVRQIVAAEITDREAAAAQYDELGRADRAWRLRLEAQALARALAGPG